MTAAAALALLPAASMAAPSLDPTGYDPDGDPNQLAIGPDGFAYVALTGNSGGKEIARINNDGSFTYFDLPGAHTIVGLTSGPDVAGGPNNRLWLSYQTGVIKYDPATSTGTDFPIGTLADGQGITPDADGNIWVVDATDGLIKLNANGTKIDDVPVAGSAGRGATLGSDGRIWWADFAGGKIRATSTASPYTTQDVTVGGGPQQVAAGPTGQIGYGAPSDSLGRIATADNTFQATTATGTDSFDVTFGRDGAYWFTQSPANKVARLTTDGTYTQPITLPAGEFPRYLAADANNNVWVQSAMGTKRIFRISGVEAPTQTTDPGAGGTGGNGGTGDQTGGGGTTTTPDTVAPLLSRAKVDTKKRQLTLTLDEPAGLQLTIEQKVKRGKKTVFKRIRAIKALGKPGANTIALGKKFKKGTYRVQVIATDAAGNKTAKPKSVGFKVK